ncbi:dihydropteroate synthase [Acidithiobacillus montserratensis]|uniref:Dihydropteroate synthase n=1 Tax=Acidithiobacillus montserratensis TaxID=2729135 RepID=A0ACD5HGU5_9PROT|nr:dihydropteroate synthase [Acidithiobacillus montserratensis]MBN2678678.1 dihydropteroate synthase [Acidithiobacillaceae bacterium]MBU2748362.1 dihydropteroate synthase [Acidithiobacillus montserratensis]
MGILNVTPDSFSDGGAFIRRDQAVMRARQIWESGADIIDIGAESTRPGAPAISASEEMERLLPVVEAVMAAVPLPVSIDTYKASVMREAWSLGAGLMNDVTALRGDPDSLALLAELQIPVCLMHMRGTPRNMQGQTRYTDLLGEVQDFFRERISACEAAGIQREQLLLDPGLGFAKDLQGNCLLLQNLEDLQTWGIPILVGVSRKSMIGTLSGVSEAARRLGGSIAAALWAVAHGAQVLRVHDVAETVQAIRVWTGIQEQGAAQSLRITP